MFDGHIGACMRLIERFSAKSVADIVPPEVPGPRGFPNMRGGGRFQVRGSGNSCSQDTTGDPDFRKPCNQDAGGGGGGT